MATEGAPPGPGARLSGADEDQGGAEGPAVAAAERPEAAYGVTMRLAWGSLPLAIDVMHKQRRLRANADFQRLRHEGQTLAHPLMILSYLPNETSQSRFGFAVGVKIGKAARRNRIKRRMREALRLRLQKKEIAEGWDMVFIARRPLAQATFQQVDEAIGLLLRRAGLVKELD